MRPKQFEFWHRSQAETYAKKGRGLPLKRIRALASFVVVCAIAWIYFFLQFSSHQITTLDEFERYLQGEDLYRKYEVTRITWDCNKLQTQFNEKYLNTASRRIEHNGNSLVFTKSKLTHEAFKNWIEAAQHSLSFGQERQIKNPANLMSALIVRLFDRFEFRSGNLHHIIANEFVQKCES